jgi:hypothetical protein
MLMDRWTATRPDWFLRATYSQRPSFNFKETFVPTVRSFTICIILTIAALEDLKLRFVDISHAYLNGELEEEIYMQQHEGFEVGRPECVCRLHKSLYGLKQVGRVWNKTLRSVLSSMGFKHAESDHASLLAFIPPCSLPIYLQPLHPLHCLQLLHLSLGLVPLF